MKKCITGFSVAMLLFFSQTVFADIKIGVLDVAQVMQQSTEVQALSQKFQNKFKPREQQIKSLQAQVKQDEEKLKRDSAIMGKSELSKLEEQLANNERKLRRLQEDFMEDARTEQKQAMDKVVKRINGEVQKIAEAEHFDLILQRANVAFASEKVDITNAVIKALENHKE